MERAEIHNPNADVSDNKDAKGAAIYIEDALYSWEASEEKPSLQDINLKVPEGKLIMVVGAVGSGKSTVAQSVLGEVPMLKVSQVYSSDVTVT